jgi:undecaprenyl-diphosphatase
MLEALHTADAIMRAWLLAPAYPAAVDAVMLAFSAAGDAGRVWLVLGLIAVLLQRSRLPAVGLMLLALLVTHLLVEVVIKPTVARERPFAIALDVRVIGERPPSLSFPSGHAATGFAGAYTLAYAWPAGRVAFWALAALIALARVYVGVHYPLDVLAGALVGLLCALTIVSVATGRRRPPSQTVHSGWR